MLFLPLDNCLDAVGLEDGRIPDEAFSDSVSDNPLVVPTNGRLNAKIENYPFGWMASPGKDDWLQVDLGSVHKVWILLYH